MVRCSMKAAPPSRLLAVHASGACGYTVVRAVCVIGFARSGLLRESTADLDRPEIRRVFIPLVTST